MKITTWNINGIRAALGKNAFEWLLENPSDIVCLQEIKAKENQFESLIFENMGYQCVWNPAERPGYSGTGMLYKVYPVRNAFGMGVPRFDNEGRIIQSSYPDFELFNIYFPNGGQELERVSYKLDFYENLLNYCSDLIKSGKEIILTGDFNTAHKEIDLKNPKSNQKNTGFLPEEREWVDKYLENGFFDIFRILYPDLIKYTWWTYRFNARKNDVGWRIDYFLITKGLVNRIKDVETHNEIMGSDHCPVTLVLE
jgi:exodeoxyribonuclease III